MSNATGVCIKVNNLSTSSGTATVLLSIIGETIGEARLLADQSICENSRRRGLPKRRVVVELVIRDAF